MTIRFTSYRDRLFRGIFSRMTMTLCVLLACFLATPAQAQLGSRVVVGYFHNWNNASAPYIRLANVDSRYNVINIAFAVPAAPGDMNMTFSPLQQSKAEFISDIQTLHAQGRRVQISIGGADAPVELNSSADVTKFVTTMKSIITEYGFDGLDIDLEATSVILNAGDNNFKSPTTPKIVNLIAAAREVTNYFRGQGKDFWLTAAPETQYVQGGYGFYGTAFGGYLPVLYGIRDLLTFVHVQYYNTGSQTGLDDKNYSQSTADFIVAMTDMLLKGFPVARNTSNMFPALRQDQVAFGLPATGTGAAPAGGYVAPAEINKALNYLVKGISYGGQYVTNATYPNLRGIMTWSVNWDATTGNTFVSNAYNYFSSLGGGNIAPTVSITSPASNASFTAGSSITINANASDSDGSVTKVEFYNGTTRLGEDTSSPYSYTWSSVAAGSYTLTAKATDNGGAVTTSSAVAITVTSTTNVSPVATLTAPASGATFTAPAAVTISANASDADGTIAKVAFYNGTTLLNEDTAAPYSYIWSSVPAGSYSIKAVATDNLGATGTSATASITVTGSTTQSPYNGTPFAIPGRIEAEQYDLGGQGIAYNDLTTGNAGTAFRSDDVDIEASTDTGGGYNIGWIQPGEWVEYTVNVASAATFNVETRIAATAAGSTFHLELDGTNISGTITAPNTGGWQTWQSVTITTTALTAGQKVLRLYVDSGEFNVNYLNFTTTTSTNPAPTASITSPAAGATFTAPASVTINATATDNVSVARVAFYNGSTLLGEDTSSPYSYTWSNVAAGTYNLTAVATDNQGATGTSAAVSITVTGGSGGNCASISQYVENSGYIAGSVVKNAGNIFECKPWPYSGWCNGAAWAYAPGTGTYWQDAWTQTGVCTEGAAIEGLTALSAASAEVAAAAGDFKIVGYMPSWQGTANAIQYSKLTHINYAFIRPTTTGGLTAVDNGSKLSSIVSLAHASGVKVGIAVGGWSDLNNADFQSMAANSTYRTNFINNLLSLINTYQLDGVDIDWEYPVDGADPANFTTLMTALGNALHSNGKFLSAAVSAQGYYANGVQSGVFNAVDFLNIMVYDGGSGADHSPYSYAVSSLDYWLNTRGLPASKAVLGVPFYARPSWSSFATLVANGANPNADTYNGDYYNGITTIKAKTNLAFDRGIGGMMMWELSQDATGANSLLSAIKQVVDERSGSGTTQSPYNGTPAAIPGKIEAEYYDLGGQGVAYNDLSSGNSGGVFRSDGVDLEATTDTGGGYNLGWVQPGEWVEYAVNVTAAGSRTLEARVAATAGGTFHLELDGTNISGTITVPNTGAWQTWQTVTITTSSLTTGQKVLRLVIDSGEFNVNYLNFTTTTSTNPAPTASITSPAAGASFTAPASVTINVTASDNGSVAKVEFYDGSTKLGEDTSSPYSYTWSSVAAGTYSLRAVATDNQGATGTSATVSITVTGGTGGCNAAQYVENGGYVAGSQVKNAGGLYQCREWPYSGWCNGAAWAYAPGTGTYWQDAWTLVGACASAASVQTTAALEEEAAITMYPNPGVSGTAHTLVLTSEATLGDVNVQINSADGITLHSQRFTGAAKTLDVDVPALPRGLYIIRVQGARSMTKRYLVK